MENNAPVFMGEFGVKTVADRTSRLAWYDKIVKEAINRGFSFACWEHQGAYEIYNYEDGNYTRTWDTEILDRLITSGTWPTFCSAKWDLVNDDCSVNMNDFAAFSSNWPANGYSLSNLEGFIQEWLGCLLMPACDTD